MKSTARSTLYQCRGKINLILPSCNVSVCPWAVETGYFNNSGHSLDHLTQVTNSLASLKGKNYYETKCVCVNEHKLVASSVKSRDTYKSMMGGKDVWKGHLKSTKDIK